MANPGKTYNLPCSLLFEYGSIGDYAVFNDIIKIGGRRFQVNSVGIDISFMDLKVEELINRDVYEHGEECDCGCGSK